MANTTVAHAVGTWTPSDQSGASLSLTVASCTYERFGSIVIAPFSITYPTTTSTAAASIGGLPVTSATGTSVGGGSPSHNDSTLTISLLVTAGATTFGAKSTSGVSITNTQLSGKTIRGVLIYPV